MNKRNVDDGDIRYARIGRHQQQKKQQQQQTANNARTRTQC